MGDVPHSWAAARFRSFDATTNAVSARSSRRWFVWLRVDASPPSGRRLVWRARVARSFRRVWSVETRRGGTRRVSTPLPRLHRLAWPAGLIEGWNLLARETERLRCADASRHWPNECGNRRSVRWEPATTFRRNDRSLAVVGAQAWVDA